MIFPTVCLKDCKILLLLTNRNHGTELLLTAVEALFWALPALPFLSPSLLYTMRSSTLYGPVTKVTVGKYFVQVANKAVDKTKEKGSEV